VAELAVQEFLEFHQTGAPVDVHLANQLLLPTALASEVSQFRVAAISSHLLSNAWAIAQFGLAAIDIEPDSQIGTITPTH
jgi:RNA 3'-terminal phosphate cyclase (ATP)